MKKPCPTCPFLEVNRGKPTPTNFKCVEFNETDWYSQANINGVWNVMRHGGEMFLSCHSSDPDYYGREGQPVHACVGASLLVHIHLQIFGVLADEHGLQKNYMRYFEAVGPKAAMEIITFGLKALRLLNGRTAPEGMLLPQHFDINLDDIRWPDGFEKSIEIFKKINQTQ